MATFFALTLVGLICAASVETRAQTETSVEAAPTPIPASPDDTKDESTTAEGAGATPAQPEAGADGDSSEDTPEAGAAVPAAQSEKESEFIPLRFSPKAIGAKLLNPRILFERTAQGVRFGGREFLFSKFNTIFESSESGSALKLRWDISQMKPNRIALIGAQGELIEEVEIKGSHMSVVSGRSLSLQNSTEAPAADVELQIDLGKIPKENLAGIQVCVWDEIPLRVGTDIQTLCTPLDRSASLADARFSVDGKPQAAKGEFSPKKKKFEISVISPTGLSFRWSSRIEVARLHEVFLRDDQMIQLTVYDGEPVGQVESLTPDRGGFFKPTIGDLRRFYRVVLSAKIPFLTVKGPRGSAIHQGLKIKSLPVMKDRISLTAPAPTATYRSYIKLWGPYKPGWELQSKEQSVEIIDDEFKWTFAAPKKNKWNRSRLRLMNSNIAGSKNTKTVFDYEIYRGFSTYLSARMGLSINSQVSASVAPDLNFIHWFEDLGSSANWSRQRWGVSAGYMKTAVSSKATENYETGYLDLYTRFTPGVEGWTESYGLQTSYFQVKYREAEISRMAGMGVFWNRSLPSWFNYFVGFMDFFKKPKWANFSAVYYPVSLQSGSKASGFQVKAVARIELTQASYFEGGWALFGATYEYRRTRVQFAAGRAYLGYGYRW